LPGERNNLKGWEQIMTEKKTTRGRKKKVDETEETTKEKPKTRTRKKKVEEPQVTTEEKPKRRTRKEIDEDEKKSRLGRLNPIYDTFNRIFLGIKNGIRKINRKEAESLILGVILTAVFVSLPFLWKTITPVVFDNQLGIYLMFAILFSSPWLGNNLGKSKTERMDNDEVVPDNKQKYFTAGILLTLSIELIIVFKYGLSGGVLLLFLFFIIASIFSVIMMHTSELASDKIKNNLEFISKLSFALAMIEYVTTGFILPYVNSQLGFLGFTILLFGLLVYLGALSPIIVGAWNYSVTRVQKMTEKSGETRISSIAMRQSYIKILAENDLKYVSELEDKTVDDLMELDGINQFDAEMILTFVFDLDDDYFSEEEE
jgi:hypothetical protein